MEKRTRVKRKIANKKAKDLLKMRYFLFLFEYPSAEEWRDQREIEQIATASELAPVLCGWH